MTFSVRVLCLEPACSASYPDHRWGAIRARSEGWFIKKNGDAWCPEHLPEWVPAWRERASSKAAT